MTALDVAGQVAAIGGQQVWHAAWLTLMWVVLAAALTVVLWGIVHPGRWLRRRNRITHLVILPPGDEIGDDVIRMINEDRATFEREIDEMVRRYGRG